MDQLSTYIWIFNILMVFALNLAVWRDMKNPAVINSMMWFSIVTLHKFLPHGLYQLESSALSVVFFSVLMFSVGVTLGQFLTKDVPFPDSTDELFPNERIVSLYVLLSIICVPLLIKSAIALASHGFTDNFFVNLRRALSDEDNPQSFGVLSYVFNVAFLAFFLRLCNTEKSLKSSYIVIPAVLCLFYALLGTGRTFFFLLLVPAFFVVLLMRPTVLGLKQIILFFGVLIAAFALMGTLLGKVGGEEKGLVDEFGLYLFGGMSAFQEILAEPQHLEYGAHTFRTPYAILAALGFDVKVTNLMQEYVFIPKPTNVYTVFQPYFLDFGLAYVFIAQFAFGLMHSYLYGFAKRKHIIGILLYSLSMYALFMQWFQDQYLTLMSQWLQYLILLLVPFFVPWLYKSLKELAAKRENSSAT